VTDEPTTDQSEDGMEVAMKLSITGPDTVRLMEVPVGLAESPTIILRMAHDEDGNRTMEVYTGEPFQGGQQGVKGIVEVLSMYVEALSGPSLEALIAEQAASREVFEGKVD
jgi:hypothetical protein